MITGKKISDVSHLKLDSVKEREDDKFTTREVFSNDYIKEKTSDHLINIQVKVKEDADVEPVKIESSQTKTSKNKNLKAQSKFALAMEEKNYVNPWMQKKFLMINLSPKNDNIIKPKKRKLKKHSQSLPQLRGLLDKVKATSVNPEHISSLKFEKMKISEVLPGFNCTKFNDNLYSKYN